MKPGRASLEGILRGCGIDLTAAQLDQLWTYHRMLRAANAELNLTRIHNFENMVLKHYADSLLVLDREELPSPLLDKEFENPSSWKCEENRHCADR